MKSTAIALLVLMGWQVSGHAAINASWEVAIRDMRRFSGTSVEGVDRSTLSQELPEREGFPYPDPE